jgi:hypothetical protein
VRRRNGWPMHLLSRILDRNRNSNGGELRYFGLSEWWSAAFARAECEHMEAAFRTPELPAGARPLTRDRGLVTFATAAGLLVALAERLSEKPGDRNLACRVLAKAEERALAEGDILGLHFTYHYMIRLHARWKERFADSLDLIFAACHKQIRLAPRAAEAFRRKSPCDPLPTHIGYLQAATMLEQQGAYAQAIELCRAGKAQGWAGNWSWRIQRLARKLPAAVRPISSSGIGTL